MQLFLQGLIVIVPIAVTIYAAVWLFTAIDNILPNIVYALFPKTPLFSNVLLYTGHQCYHPYPADHFYWLDIFLIFCKPLVAFFDRVLEHTPGVKFIYTSVKDFLEAFAGNKRKFDKPVLVNVDGADVWRVGFITHEDAHNLAWQIMRLYMYLMRMQYRALPI